MGIESIENLKEFIIWCRKNGVNYMKVDGIEFNCLPLYDEPLEQLAEPVQATDPQADLMAFMRGDY